MARSFSNAKIILPFVADRFSVIIASRRGYAAASEGAVSSVGGGGGGGRSNVILRKGGEESGKTTSWVPDPVTGYYRPESKTEEIDAADLRQMLIKNKN